MRINVHVQEFENEKAGGELRGGGNNYYLCMYSSMCVYMCVCGLVLILDSETAPTLRKST